MQVRHLITLFALMLGVLIGWLLLQDASQVAEKAPEPERKATSITHEPSFQDSDRRRTLNGRKPSFEDLLALPNQRLIKFDNEQAYQDFLRRLKNSDLELLGKSDQLWVAGVRYGDLSDLLDLGLEEDDLLYNFPVNIPPPGNVEAQPGVVGFGTSALAFLGITENNSNYGKGVKIAIVDSGVEPHIALSKGVTSINLTDIPEGSEPHGHGTAVASLIAGDHPNLTGVAPAAELISVRVTDTAGGSDSLTLARGIVAAAESGAHIINISMGSYGNSLVVQNAIDFAIEQGAAIFASPGNDGFNRAAFPAAHEGVTAVGANDARGVHLNFSNTSEDLGLTAPGLEVQAAWPGDQVIAFTGTSASSPFGAGAVAAIMSEMDLTAQQATELMLDFSNEAGVAGSDPFYGNGVLHVGRALQSETPGIEDIAVASQYFPETNENGSSFQVVLENRGTETVWHSDLEVSVDGNVYPYQINSLEPNATRTIALPFGSAFLERQGSLNIRSTLKVSSETNDILPRNNVRAETFTSPSRSAGNN